MKTTLNRKALALFFIFIFCIRAKAQLSSVYSELNISEITTPIFLNQSAAIHLPPFPDGYHELSNEGARQIFFEFNQAALDPNFFEDEMIEYRRQLTDYHSLTGTTSITVLDCSYNYLREDAFIENLVSWQNGVLTPTTDESLIEESKTMVFFIEQDKLEMGLNQFVFQPEHFFYTAPDAPSEVRIDFDDGLGWRTVQWNVPMDIYYLPNQQNVHWRMEVQRGNEVLYSGLSLKVTQCMSSFPEPNTSPWPIMDPEYPWYTQTIYNNEWIGANAYTLTSEDGLFDKPFLFVEGIDFDRWTSPLRNGSFGWCEFTSGNSDMNFQYHFLHEMSELLFELRDHGYDIVLVDFKEGFIRMEKNAAVLQHIIQLCNQYKVGSQELVVAGASMGGQVARFALRDMELNDQSHCTRLYISLDSPHAGAYIPASLQAALEMIQFQSESAYYALHEKLQSEAAKQLLKVQLNNNDWTVDQPEYVDWFNTLNEMGMPQGCTNIAIANGNANGIGLNYGDFTPEFDWSCDVSPLTPGDEAHFYLMPLPGDPWHENSTDDFYTIAEVDLVTALWMLDPDDIYFQIVSNHQERMAHHSLPRWDYASGGVSTIVSDFARTLNANHVFWENGCEIQPWNYREYHCFIPTSSAFGIETAIYNLDVEAYLNEHPEDRIFDEYYFNHGLNQFHSEVVEEHVDFVLNYIFANEDESGQMLLTDQLSEGVFNYGHAGFNTLHQLVVHENGVLAINDYAPIHFNQNYPELGSTFEVFCKASCGDAIVGIEEGGELRIGNESGLTSGKLIVEDGGILQVNNLGMLRIFPNSELVIRNGGLLQIDMGAKVSLEGGSVIIEEGGIIEHNGGQWVWNNPESAFVFAGGLLSINDFVVFSIEAPTNITGYVKCTSNDAPDIYFGDHAKFYLAGSNSNDLIFLCTHNSEWRDTQFGISTVVMVDGLIDLSYGGRWDLASNLQLQNVQFLNQEQNEGSGVHHYGSVMTSYSCNWLNVPIRLFDSKLTLHDAKLQGSSSGVESFQSSYAIHRCSFEDCGVEGSSTSADCEIVDTDFTIDQGYLNAQSVKDEGPFELSLKRCFVEHGICGVHKEAGTLRLKCNEIRGNEIGCILAKTAVLNASSTEGGGYNRWMNNAQHLYFDEAGIPLIEKGYNVFQEDGVFFSGSINVACGSGCEPAEISAYANCWSLQNQPGMLLPNNYSVLSLNDCGQGLCEVVFLDENPTSEVECPNDLELHSLKSQLNGNVGSIYPIPFDDHLTINVDFPMHEILLYNGQGQLVLKQIAEGLSQIEMVNLKKLAPGCYTIVLNGPEQTERQFRVVKF